jgi:DNA-nicking Smr family endonuclease
MKNAALHAKSARRGLSREELKLWFDATRSVVPIAGARLPQLPDEPVHPDRPLRNRATPAPKQEKAEPSPRQDAIKTHRTPPPIDRRLRQKLSRGQATPEAVIDLHGLHQREALLALRDFLLQTQRSGARLVLVVTGKGSTAAPGDFTPGILRRRVPDWLGGAEYRPIVAGFEQAARLHGGSGALYVTLKRRSHAKAKGPMS